MPTIILIFRSNGFDMKLSGKFSIELPVGEYFSTAAHRQRLEDILNYIRVSYPDATLSIREKRNRKARPPSAPPRVASGALNRYVGD